MQRPEAMKTQRVCIGIVLLAAFALTFWPVAVMCGPVIAEPAEISLQVGDSKIIECKDVTRTAVGDPMIADVAVLSSNEILVNAKSPGKTVVYTWDQKGRKVYRIVVQPAELDLPKLCQAIEQELNDPRITVRGVGNTIILEGTVSREAESSRAEAIANAVVEMAAFQGVYAGGQSAESRSIAKPEGDSFVIEKVTQEKQSTVTAQVGLRCPKVVNLIQIEKPLDEVSVRTIETANALRQAFTGQDLTVRALPGSVVLVEGKVGTDAELAKIDLIMKGWEKAGTDDKGMSPEGGNVEKVTMVNAVQVDSSVARQVMVRAQVLDIDKTALKQFGVDWGRVVSTPITVEGVGTVATDVSVEDQPFLIGQTGLGPFDLFGGGDIRRFDPIGARVRALQMQNKARVLSEPNLLVLDGREASMLVGGEIPVPVVQSIGTGGAPTVTIEYKEFGIRLKIQPNVTGEDRMQLKVAPEVSTLDFSNAVAISGFRIPALRSRKAETTVNVRDGQSLIIAGLLQNDTAKLVKKIPILGDIPILGELFKDREFVNNETELVIIITPQLVRPGEVPAATAPSAEPPTGGEKK